MPAFPPGVHLKGGRNAAPVLAELAREFYAPLIPIVVELHRQGLSLRAIAVELEHRGITSRWGWPRWSAAQVRRVLLRAGVRAETAPAPAQAAAAAGPEPASEPAPAKPADIWLWVGPYTAREVKAFHDRTGFSPEARWWREGMQRSEPIGTLLTARHA